ncbi:hypothetical protein LSCM1_08243 [Leishmania martiniquensis]|uniref:Uncharacterized protein n=1 Tax=Leishmania martiniquensis TaxID=1580590 RepID=A0A836L466_9TRYP|nr:hypothetical protein LSCM1_08243 [Leishmania martiniquensis]
MDGHVAARVKRVLPLPALDGDSDAAAASSIAASGSLTMRAKAWTEADGIERVGFPAGCVPATMSVNDDHDDGPPAAAQAPHAGPHRGPANRERVAVADISGYAPAQFSQRASTAAPAALRCRRSGGLARHLMGCGSRVHRMLRALGFADDDDANAPQTLACACAAVGVLAVLLLISFAALAVVLVVMPTASHRPSQGNGPPLDVHINSAGGARVSDVDARRVLAGGNIQSFLRDSLRRANLQRRLQHNATLFAALRNANALSRRAAGHSANGWSRVQALPELEHLSFLLHEVSAYIEAVQMRDPVTGLAELSDFLLNAKGRREALQRAAERARADAVSMASATAAGASSPTARRDAAEWNAALKESFAGRSEAARLRAQLRGFIGVSSFETERMTEQPFDDLALLQYRHAWAKSEVLPMMRARSRRAGVPGAREGAGAEALQKSHAMRPPQNASPGASAAPLGVCDVVNRMAMKADLYEVSSIWNHVYYYPLRRYTALRPYSGDSVADTDAWYSAIAAAVQTRFGVPITQNKVRPTETATPPMAQRDSPLSALALPRLTFGRAAEVAHLHSAEDRQGMPEALNAKAAVNTKSIFVSIASYRDVECAPTVLNLFRTARNPSRLHIGLVQQNLDGDPPCLMPEMYTPYLCPSGGLQGAAADGGVDAARQTRARARTLYGEGTDFAEHSSSPDARHFGDRICFLAEQVRLREIDARHAKGPTYGRYMAMLLYRGEDLVLVLDSHNRFRPMWDAFSASMLLRFEDRKAVLSHYPEAYPGENASLRPYRTSVAYLCRAHFLQNLGYIRLAGIVALSPVEFAKNNAYNDPYVRVKSEASSPASNFRLPQPWAAGGLLMSFGTILRDVPFDPHLSYIFDGEEVLYSVRLWTHGYNIYSPARGFCFHIYGRPSAPKVWSASAVWYSMQVHVRKRVQFYLQSRRLGKEDLLVPANSTNLHVVVDSSRYGMGKQRTVAQWYDYAGVDPIKYEVDGRWCGKDTSA